MAESVTTDPAVPTLPAARWWRIGGSLLAGLFVAYLDRTNLSVALPTLSRDLGFAGHGFPVTASLVLTIFLIGYTLANLAGGLLTGRIDPRTVALVCFAAWSLATVAVAATSSLAVLLACRLVLGVAEGVYWPQQSRFVRGWFALHELTRANGLVQFYGQFLALALGFAILTPLYDAFGWRMLFLLTGGLGLLVVVPLFAVALRPETEAPFRIAPGAHAAAPTLAMLGGPPFLLLVFSYVAQGMLFWGITLWIPLTVRSLGFAGWHQALASALPYLAAVVLAVPLSRLADRTGRRAAIAASGLIVAGLLLLPLPLVHAGGPKLALITAALGIYAAAYTPNIWSILQRSVDPRAVGAASGIMNGIGAGGGGTAAGFLVGMLHGATGSYTAGFAVLGGLALLGGAALLAYAALFPCRTADTRLPARPDAAYDGTP